MRYILLLMMLSGCIKEVPKSLLRDPELVIKTPVKVTRGFYANCTGVLYDIIEWSDKHTCFLLTSNCSIDSTLARPIHVNCLDLEKL